MLSNLATKCSRKAITIAQPRPKALQQIRFLADKNEDKEKRDKVHASDSTPAAAASAVVEATTDLITKIWPAKREEIESSQNGSDKKKSKTVIEKEEEEAEYTSYMDYVKSFISKPKKKVITHPALTREQVVKKTHVLADSLLNAVTLEEKLKHTEALNRHFLSFPASNAIAVEGPLVRHLLTQLHTSSSHVDEAHSSSSKRNLEGELKAQMRQCLALCGHIDPPRGPGVCVLAIDGGGMRGMVGLEMLEEIERRAGGKKICELFDLVVGVSTGSIIASLLCVKGMGASEAKKLYEETAGKLFRTAMLSRFSRLAYEGSFHNSTYFISLLKEILGEDFKLIDTAHNPKSPKLAIVSCLMNTQKPQAHLFRNYEYPIDCYTHYRGTTQYPLWQAVLASAAAPVHFKEVSLGSMLHTDGGVICNNPTAIALHEARLLWPKYDLQCVVSVGNSRAVSELDLVAKEATSLFGKFNKLIDAASDTENVHNCVSVFLPPHVYYRLNPYTKFYYDLDECDPEKLRQMSKDSQYYIRRNRILFDAVMKQLTETSVLMKFNRIPYVLTLYWWKVQDTFWNAFQRTRKMFSA